jgi:hypothetical protein
MRARGPVLASLLVLAASLVACGGALSKGRSQFDKGNYPEAKQTFAAAEADSRSWSDARRAEYALYRGLTLGALGDQAHAGVWLREAKAIEDAHPGSLDPQEAQRLHLGLESTQ